MQQGVLLIALLSLLTVGTLLNLSSKGELSFPTPSHSYELTGTYTKSRVKSVIDGDTIELENGDRVRYIGMNTPEIAHENGKEQCFGREAAVANKKLVEGKVVALVRDEENRDAYGRLLRYVFVDSLFVNEELVSRGYARTLRIFPNIRFEKIFETAQSDAKNRKAGLWKACSKFFVDK